jgi:hypothetical protein
MQCLHVACDMQPWSHTLQCIPMSPKCHSTQVDCLHSAQPCSAPCTGCHRQQAWHAHHKHHPLRSCQQSVPRRMPQWAPGCLAPAVVCPTAIQDHPLRPAQLIGPFVMPGPPAVSPRSLPGLPGHHCGDPPAQGVQGGGWCGHACGRSSCGCWLVGGLCAESEQTRTWKAWHAAAVRWPSPHPPPCCTHLSMLCHHPCNRAACARVCVCVSVCVCVCVCVCDH